MWHSLGLLGGAHSARISFHGSSASLGPWHCATAAPKATATRGPRSHLRSTRDVADQWAECRFRLVLRPSVTPPIRDKPKKSPLEAGHRKCLVPVSSARRCVAPPRRWPPYATALRSASPRTQRLRLSRKMSTTRAALPSENPALCGVAMTLGSDQTGESAGSGSWANTSR